MRKEIPIPSFDGTKLVKASIDFNKGLFVAEYEKEEDKDVILVPDNIKIYKPNRNDDQLFIGFGYDQMLGYYQGAYVVRVLDKDVPIKPTQCKLVPCKQEELMAGDTAFCYSDDMDLTDLMNYMTVLCDGSIDFVCTEEAMSISVYTDFQNEDYIFYKVVPI